MRNGALALLLLAASAPLQAEPETGSLIDKRPAAPAAEDWSGDEAAIRVVNGLGRCKAQVRPEPIAQIVAMPYGDAAQSAAVRQAISRYDDCIGPQWGSVRFSLPLAVGGMAEELLKERYADADVAAAVAATILVEPRNGIEDIGLCILRRNPSGVRTLWLSAPTSPSERRAVQQILPDLGPCIPAGSTFHLKIPTVRALLAITLYRVVDLAAHPQALAAAAAAKR